MVEKKRLWEGEEGYFTSEASFLVTFVFLLLFAVILSGLYICDLNQAKSFLNERVTELSSNQESYDSNALLEDKNQIPINPIIPYRLSCATLKGIIAKVYMEVRERTSMRSIAKPKSAFPVFSPESR